MQALAWPILKIGPPPSSFITGCPRAASISETAFLPILGTFIKLTPTMALMNDDLSLTTELSNSAYRLCFVLVDSESVQFGSISKALKDLLCRKSQYSTAPYETPYFFVISAFEWPLSSILLASAHLGSTLFITVTVQSSPKKWMRRPVGVLAVRVSPSRRAIMNMRHKIANTVLLLIDDCLFQSGAVINALRHRYGHILKAAIFTTVIGGASKEM